MEFDVYHLLYIVVDILYILSSLEDVLQLYKWWIWYERKNFLTVAMVTEFVYEDFWN